MAFASLFAEGLLYILRRFSFASALTAMLSHHQVLYHPVRALINKDTCSLRKSAGIFLQLCGRQFDNTLENSVRSSLKHLSV